MAATDTDNSNEYWLQDFFQERLHENVCFNNYCTMCIQGFTKALCKVLSKQLGFEISHSNFFMTRTNLVGEGAEVLLQGLAQVHPIDETSDSFAHPEWREVEIRYLVLRVWRLLGGEKSEPEMERVLVGSWAGEALTRMQAHHKVRMTERRAWEDYHDPATVQLRREEKRRPKQERHAKRLVQQKERACEWHAKHRKDDSQSK